MNGREYLLGNATNSRNFPFPTGFHQDRLPVAGSRCLEELRAVGLTERVRSSYLGDANKRFRGEANPSLSHTSNTNSGGVFGGGRSTASIIAHETRPNSEMRMTNGLLRTGDVRPLAIASRLEELSKRIC